MRKPGGYLLATDRETGKVTESETFTCKHCNRVVFVNTRQHPEDAGGLCYSCSGLICKHCVGKGCEPLERKLENWYRQDELYRSMRG